MKTPFQPPFWKKSKKTTNKTFGHRYGIKLWPPQPQPQVLNLRLRSQNFSLWSNTGAKVAIVKTSSLLVTEYETLNSKSVIISQGSSIPLFPSFQKKIVPRVPPEILFFQESTTIIKQMSHPLQYLPGLSSLPYTPYLYITSTGTPLIGRFMGPGKNRLNRNSSYQRSFYGINS